MSQSIEQSDLFKAFLELKGFKEVWACPYCGKDFPHYDPSDSSCCGEVGHITTHWTDEREILDETDIKKSFQAWIEERTEEAEASRYSEKDEPEYWEDR